MRVTGGFGKAGVSPGRHAIFPCMQANVTRLVGGWALLIVGATQLARVLSLAFFASGAEVGWAAALVQALVWLILAVAGLRLVVRGNRGRP